MIFTRTFALAGALALSATAAPVAQVAPASTCTLTAEKLIAIDPNTATCVGAEFPLECADAARAAPAISASFKKYEIESKGAQAALIGIMLFESGSFKYNKNHFPGRPGQGTRNMQMLDFNKEYATSLFGAEKATAASGTDGVLGLVLGDEASFGSAAWFLNTKCPASIKAGLADGSSAGWIAYLTDCVGTEHTADRDVAWTAAKKALGI